jgi:hypothetical protein
VIRAKTLLRAASAGGGIVGVVWLAGALFRLAACRRSGERYWVLKGTGRDFFICARVRGDRRATLCVFDSERAAGEYARSLSESRVFLDTLEWYGTSIPPWARHEPLLPWVCEVSGQELRRIVGAMRICYVTLNQSPPESGAKTLELRDAGTFVRGRRTVYEQGG